MHTHTHTLNIFLQDHFCLPPCNRINEPIRGKSKLLSFFPHCILASVFLNAPARAHSRTAGVDQWENLSSSAGHGDSTYYRSRWPHQASIWLPRQVDQVTKEHGSNASLSKWHCELHLRPTGSAKLGPIRTSKTWNMDELAGKETIFGRCKFQTTFQVNSFFCLCG